MFKCGIGSDLVKYIWRWKSLTIMCEAFHWNCSISDWGEGVEIKKT